MYNSVASPLSPVRDTWSTISRSRELTPPSVIQGSTSNAPSPESSTDSQPKEDDLGHYDLADHLERLSVKTDRFFGSASTFALAQSAMRIRSEYTGAESSTYVKAHSANWLLQPVRRTFFCLTSSFTRDYSGSAPRLNGTNLTTSSPQATSWTTLSQSSSPTCIRILHFSISLHSLKMFGKAYISRTRRSVRSSS